MPPEHNAPIPGSTNVVVTRARACAYEVLRRVAKEGAWADRALHGEAQRHHLEALDRALATQLAYGTIQRQATLDHMIGRAADRPAEKLDLPLLLALRLGAYQLLFLDRVPDHAAVGESVELAKAHAPAGAGLVNAVLRRIAREGSQWLKELPDKTPEQAAIAHSHPEWITSLWFDLLGAQEARQLLASDNRPAEPSLRTNTLKTTREELLERLPAQAAPDLPEALVLTEPFDAFGSPEWREGLFMPQSRAAMSVAHTLDPQPGERVLDLCAAPGGKTTHLAALMRNQGQVVAVERHPGRAEALRKTAARMGAHIVEVRTADAAQPQESEAYDRVLVDPPCSDLGTLASRPDARWRKQPEDVERLAAQQRRLLEAAEKALKPGGTLVYSTCTISRQENEAVVEAVWDDDCVASLHQTLPHRDGTEGFFVARLVKP